MECDGRARADAHGAAAAAQRALRPSTLLAGRAPIGLAAPSEGLGRACAPRSAASAAWRLGVVGAARLRPPQGRECLSPCTSRPPEQESLSEALSSISSEILAEVPEVELASAAASAGAEAAPGPLAANGHANGLASPPQDHAGRPVSCGVLCFDEADLREQTLIKFLTRSIRCYILLRLSKRKTLQRCS